MCASATLAMSWHLISTIASMWTSAWLAMEAVIRSALTSLGATHAPVTLVILWMDASVGM